jgi:serine/threonine-protein kinase
MGQEAAAKRIGDYEIVGLVGQGGMGVVYRALDTTIGRTVAIKMLKGAFAEDPDLLKRFYREAQSTGKLQHKNIVTVYSLGDHEGIPYLVIEFLDGESVLQIISSRRNMTLVDKLDLAIQVCDGLQYAHQRELVHRDIKPANIIVTKEGVAKIVDFGIARIGGTEGLTHTGQLVGSMYYMSPEQINGLPLDGRSDIFSAAVMFYELLTYTLPFKGTDTASTFMKILREPPPPLAAFLPDYPKELDQIFNTALAKQADDRYQTAEEFGFDLLQVQQNLKRSVTSDLLRDAETDLRNGTLDHARQILHDILKLDRQNAKANELLHIVRQAIQKQQRASQIAQLRSQAEVAFGSSHFEEALACMDQALRLDPADTSSIELRGRAQVAIDRTKNIHDAVNRAESSLLAGDLDEANASVHQALNLDPEHTAANALRSVVERELAERARRQRVQTFVESARQNISERNYMSAIQSLHEAEVLDPADSNVRELLRWATKGQEQEQRRKKFDDATARINEAMQQQDFASAIQMCAMALADFPDEPSLLRIKSLAEREAELLERRRFVQEQSLKARDLAAAGKHDHVVALLTTALQRFPGEPNLQALLDVSNAAIAQAREAEQSARKSEDDRQRWLHAWESLTELCEKLRRGLDAHAPLDSLADAVRKLNDLVPTMSADEDARQLALPLLLEYETRRSAYDKAAQDLDLLARTPFTPDTSFPKIETRLRECAAAWPRDPKIESLTQRIRQSVDEYRISRIQEASKAAPQGAAAPKSKTAEFKKSAAKASAAAPAAKTSKTSKPAVPPPVPAPLAPKSDAVAAPSQSAAPKPAPVPSEPATSPSASPVPVVSEKSITKDLPFAPRSPRTLWIAAVSALFLVIAAGVIWKATRPAPFVEVRADSTPAGAVVHLGNQSCTAPCSLRVKPGSYTASAELSGYDKAEQPVVAQSNTTASFTLTAVPAAAGSTPPAPQLSPSPAPAAVTPPTDDKTAATGVPAPVSEHDAWLSVKDSRNIAELRRFVQHYPHGAYQSQAKAKLEDLVWHAAIAANTPAAIQGYVHDYPTGFYVAQANVELSRIEWQSQALQTATDPARLQDFARRYPSGEYHDRALARIDDLHWADVHPNDAATLHAYLDRSPNGRHAAEAHAALDQIQRASQQAAAKQAAIPVDPPEVAAVKTALADFDRAYRAKDLAALERVWPNAKKSKEVVQLFQGAASVELVTTIVGAPEIKGNKAQAKCSQSLTATTNGQPQHTAGQVTIRFKKSSSGAWQIDNIH